MPYPRKYVEGAGRTYRSCFPVQNAISNSENTYTYNGTITCPRGFVRAFPADKNDLQPFWGCGANCGDHKKEHDSSGCGSWGVTDSQCNCACITVAEANRRKAAADAEAAAKAAAAKAAADAAAAERERQRLAAIAAEAAAAAERERQRLAAIARAAAKAAAKKKWEDAEADAAAKLKAIDDRKKEYNPAAKTVLDLKLVYDNAQGVANDAKTKKAAYDDAIAQQTAANTLLITATNGLNAAKAKVKAAWETAQAAADAALTALNAKKAESATAANTVLSLKTVYENAQMAADNAKATKATMEDALAQQTAANALLTAATNALSGSNVKIQGNLDKLYGEQADFIKNATVFPNTTFGIDKQYNVMSIDWTAYNAAKADLAKTDAKNVLDSTAATNTLLETYNKFVASKDTYNSAVIPAIQSSKTDIDYLKTNDSIADTYEAVYGLRSKQYSPMADAWAAVTKSMDASDTTGTLVNYSTYLVAKTNYATALLVAEGKRAEAEFQTKLAAGREAAAQWAKSGTNGCRRIQTVATTDANMLDQNIACSDTEYISGYVKVAGYNAAPVDPNVSRDNIGQYLAVKYSCCTAPTAPKGERGKKGLPGLDGAPGLMGPEGPVGIDGPVGKKGESGDSGEEGEKGPRGDAGDNGINGEAGPPGKAGESVKVPYIRQVPGPQGQPGQRGPMGPMGPKGPDGVIKPAPPQPFSEVDRTLALFNIQEKINKYARG